MLSNQNPSDSPSWGPFQNFQPNFLSGPTAEIQSENFQPTIPPDFPPGFHRNFQPNTHPHHPVRFHSNISQETSMSRPKLTPNCCQKKSYHNTPATFLLQKHTQMTLFHTPNLPPILFSCQHSLHSISHMGYTVLIVKAGSHTRFQSRMHSCIQSCARVRNILLP